MSIYTVSTGDSLWRISRVHNVSITELMKVNGLESAAIIPGLNLYIPDEALIERSYQVKSGDTLWSIARQFNITVQAIIQANPGLNPYLLQPNTRLQIPTNLRYTMQTLVFIDAFDPSPYVDILTEIAKNITYLAVFTYYFDSTGALIEANDEEIIQICKQLNIQPLMVVSNYEAGTFSAELADLVLVPDVRQILIRNIINAVTEKGYAGVSIDFEFVPPTRRQDFTQFLRELKTALGRRILQINAHAKMSDDPTNRVTGFLDYWAIGEIVDIMAVMTIDYGYAIGPPDPIAPVWWIEQVLRYATGQVNRRKIMMAIAMYGYDWTLPQQTGRMAEMISAREAQNRAIANGVSIQYDLQSQAPNYYYQMNRTDHQVWFEDIRSVDVKYKLIDVYQLLGTSYWRLRFQFPQNWAYVEKNIVVEK